MRNVMRCVGWISLVGCALGVSGCARMFHDLQFHRLWRLNRGPGMSSDAYFSVPPADAPESNKAAPSNIAPSATTRRSTDPSRTTSADAANLGVR